LGLVSSFKVVAVPDVPIAAVVTGSTHACSTAIPLMWTRPAVGLGIFSASSRIMI
jgi:hypothetical protein